MIMKELRYNDKRRRTVSPLRLVADTKNNELPVSSKSVKLVCFLVHATRAVLRMRCAPSHLVAHLNLLHGKSNTVIDALYLE